MLKRLNSLFKEKKRFITFCVGNHIVFWLELLITFVLTEFVMLRSYSSYAISLMIGFVILFVFHQYYTFKVFDNRWMRMIDFIIVTITFSMFNWGITYFLTTKLEIYYLISIILASGLTVILSYKTNKNYVFNQQLSLKQLVHKKNYSKSTNNIINFPKTTKKIAKSN